jgi:hypothetical protein
MSDARGSLSNRYARRIVTCVARPQHKAPPGVASESLAFTELQHPVFASCSAAKGLTATSARMVPPGLETRPTDEAPLRRRMPYRALLQTDRMRRPWVNKLYRNLGEPTSALVLSLPAI